MSWLTIKAKLAIAGALLMSALAFFFRMQSLKNRNEILKRQADTLKARAHQQKIVRKEEKKLSEEFHSRETDLVKELEKHREKKEDFKGLDNLNRPNDW